MLWLDLKIKKREDWGLNAFMKSWSWVCGQDAPTLRDRYMLTEVARGQMIVMMDPKL